MGHFIYGGAPAVEVDDWALQHLQTVIITKLRRGESFSYSWDTEPAVGADDASERPGSHGTVWISKGSSLYFSFDQRTDRPLNRKWLGALADAANTTSGLRLLPEPGRVQGDISVDDAPWR